MSFDLNCTFGPLGPQGTYFLTCLSKVLGLRSQFVWLAMLVFGLLLTIHILHLLYNMFLPWRDLSILFDEDDLGTHVISSLNLGIWGELD